MDWVLIIGGVAMVLLAVLLAVFVRCFVRWPKPYERLELPCKGAYARCWEMIGDLLAELEGAPYEEMRIRSEDGIELAARYYHVQDGAPIEIQLHGYRSSYQDFCGGFRLAREMGHNVLLVHQRAHGESGGRVITFGIRERRDCRLWARYMAEKYPGTPIFLCGVSMGAATVLMATELDLPSAVRGVIADCPYSSPEAIIRKVSGEDLHLPPALTMPLVRLSAMVFGGFRLSEASACEALSKATLPVLLIHGEDDGFVPCAMSRELETACASSVTLLTVPGADHGISYMIDTPGYGRAVREFVERALVDDKPKE